MRRRVAVILGFFTFCAALGGFLFLGVAAQSGEVRVLVASRTIAAGQVLRSTTVDLSPGGALVHLSAAAQSDAIPERNYREVQGAVALVTIPAGALILRHDLALGSGASLRQLSLSLAFIPSGLSPGDRVDLFAVSGPQAGNVAPAADLCGDTAAAGCVVPLAQAVAVVASDQSSRAITIAVSPGQVAPWLLLDATEPIWAVPAGAVSCEGTEQAISNPYQALLAIRQGTAAEACSRAVPASGAG
ncbi:MAG TPA: SAF domain-containing protein [Candidatus Dormibacteraeota bacterium]|nr:SAF domain-containing protein [Candidatus Dormibacteraeota bacterium]